MTFLSQQNQNSLVAFFPDIDKINTLVAHEFEMQLNELLKQSSNELILDLSNIRFIDSSGFQALKNAKATFNQKQVSIKNANDDVKELFELLNLDKEFCFIDN